MLDEDPTAALQEDAAANTPTDRPGVIHRLGRTYLRRERPRGLFEWERKNQRPSQVAGSNIAFLVAGTGFEPVTSGL